MKTTRLNMDRNRLICAHFDAYSDLKWVKNLEPKFKAALWDAEEIEAFRQAWMAITETRDWDRWQEKVSRMTDAELQREIAECQTEIGAFRKGRDAEGQQFRRILDGKEAPSPIQPKARDRGREM